MRLASAPETSNCQVESVAKYKPSTGFEELVSILTLRFPAGVVSYGVFIAIWREVLFHETALILFC